MDTDVAKISKPQLNRLYLLVFHGGLVAYLYLHNLIMPIVKNFGLNQDLHKNIQLYFIPHTLLLICFFFRDHRKVDGTWIPTLINANISMVLGSGIVFLYDSSDGLSLTDFSSLISVIAVTIFFIGFYTKFANDFQLLGTRPKKNFIIGLSLGGLFLLLNTISIHPAKLNISTTENTLSQNTELSKELINIRIPHPNNQEGHILLNSKQRLYYSDIPPTVKNNTDHVHMIRLEKSKNNRWVFKKIIRIDVNENITLDLNEAGFYRLRSPSSKDLHEFVIVYGQGQIPVGNYKINKKGEVNYESN